VSNLSNYLFAVGSHSEITRLKGALLSSENAHEFQTVKVNAGSSILTIQKSDETNRFESQNFFFKGWFSDPKTESVVIGAEGFHKWKEENGKDTFLDQTGLQGSYVNASWSEEKVRIHNDLFSMFPIMYFSEKNIFVASDSLYVLAKIRAKLGLNLSHNTHVSHARAWTHGLACAATSNETQVSGIHLLSPGKSILIEWRRYQQIFSLQEEKLKSVFRTTRVDYGDVLNSFITETYRTFSAFFNRNNIEVELAISGGLDSRLLLALLLEIKKKNSGIYFVTNNHTSRRTDFLIVESLSKRFDFEFNNRSTQKEGREMIKQNSLEKKFSMWRLSCMGLFDMMYFNGDYPKEASVVRVGGHGAEIVKGTFREKPFNSLIKKKRLSRKSIISRDVFRLFKQIKNQNKRVLSIETNFRNALASSGIRIEENDAILWHHLCYKSPIANSRYLANSTLGYRPLVDRNLFTLTLNEPSKCADIVQDLLILISPELALHEFENPAYNMDEIHIAKRKKVLPECVKLSELEPFKLYSGESPILNGPPVSFLDLVPKMKTSFASPEVMIKALLESTWRALGDSKLKEVYQPAYDLAKKRFGQEKVYFPSAATPAAKIISLALTESELFDLGI